MTSTAPSDAVLGPAPDPAPEEALTPAGERLLEAASALFYRRGIRAVGVDLIAETAGTTKKTLYDRFGSKDELVARYLRRRARVWRAFLRAGMSDAPLGPGRPAAVFDVLEAWLREQDRGCAFVNAYAEVGGTDHPAVAEIRAEKQWMLRYLVALVAEAGVPDADRVGTELHLLYEGATVLATAAGVVDAPARARAAALRVLAV
ncbi:TetR/AcrR family transcriptional regulator [Pseudonocardia humida]|uniref:TetR/AcrR family transcriptional regulator n=1 Tax=Pseudonocardia humida TaxID=2800819 RepID=A0ABT0ZZ72_9PSEU|nr:TetR/AcrR family transcriptional regulator [Pseudonocardia humida]MCO1656037.1 TetR/AcrR family transcriptional regulator [Pseudonocardia humida]